jgi:predicted anti-sigma-YlaC factor YlaD
MDCRSLLDRLEALLDGTLGGEDLRAAEEHLRGCAECRGFVELARTEPQAPVLEPPADLAGSILEKTSGSACDGARDRLGDHVDGTLEGLDSELVRLHLDGCRECEGLARALASLAAELPAMAEIEPDAAFVDDVLAKTTSRRRRFPRQLEKLASIRDLWPRVVNRPRFALEAAYVATLVVVLVFGPNLPLAGMSQRAIDLVRAGSRVETGDVRTRVVSGTRDLWSATGGGLAADLAERYERTGGTRFELRLRADELVEAARDTDPAAAADALRGIRSDLGTLWEHLASNESEEGVNPDRRQP